MEGSSPSVILMRTVNILLLFSEHEPVETHDDHVANDGHGVKQMVLGLHVNSFLWSEEGVFPEINGVLRCANTGPERKGCEHECPIGERDKEAIPVHVKTVSHVAA